MSDRPPRRRLGAEGVRSGEIRREGDGGRGVYPSPCNPAELLFDFGNDQIHDCPVLPLVVKFCDAVGNRLNGFCDTLYLFVGLTCRLNGKEAEAALMPAAQKCAGFKHVPTMHGGDIDVNPTWFGLAAKAVPAAFVVVNVNA